MADRDPARPATRWTAAVLAVPAILGVVLAAYLVQGRVLAFDAGSLFAPYFSLLADCARAGRLLLWNPWSNCGSPDMAYVEMGSFSPLTLAIALVTGGGDTGFLVYWIAIWALGGAGLVVLGQSLGASPWGALLVAVGWLFSGVWLGHASHTSWLYAFAFLPWILWRLDAALGSGRRLPALEAGALVGLSALAGHPAVVILNGLFAAAWTVGRVLFGGERSEGSDDRVRPGRAALALAALAVTGALVLLPAYGAFFLEGAGYSDRTGFLPREVAVGDQQLPPGAVVTLASPYLSLLKTYNKGLWRGTWMGLTCLYVGALLPSLGLLGLAARGRGPGGRRWRLWLAGLGLAALACALGTATPVRGWVYDLVPPTRYFRHSSVFRFHALFALAVLALHGTAELRRGGPAAWRRWGWLSTGTSSAALLAYALFLASLKHTGPRASLAHVHVVLVWVLAPLLILLGARRAASGRAGGARAALLVLAAVDGGLACTLAAPMMSIARDPADRVPRVRELDCSLERQRHAPGSTASNLNLYEKVPTLENFNTLDNRFHTRRGVGNAEWFNLRTSIADEPVLARCALGAAHRFWFAPETVEVVPSDANFYAFVARARELGSLPAVVHDRSAMLDMPRSGAPGPDDAADTRRIRGAGACHPLTARLGRYDPRHLDFVVEAPEDGWLLVTDRWARGWRATVDGSPVDVRGAAFVFRAVPIAAGRRRVEFLYDPPLHPWLLVLSWGVLAAVVGARMRARGGRVGASEGDRAPDLQIRDRAR